MTVTPRPLVLAFGVLVHAGIAVCFGMMTFGLSMIVANVAFVSPRVIRSLAKRDQPDPWDVALERASGIPFGEEPRVAIGTASAGSSSNDATRRELVIKH